MRLAAALTCALIGCGSTSAKDPPPAAPSSIARAAYQARSVPLRPPSGAESDQFPVIAPDTPFGSPPPATSGAPTATKPSDPTGTPL